MTVPFALLRTAISIDTAAKISDFVGIKQPAKVVKQTPAAGTPVIQGMTIEVQATSLSDVPIFVIDANIATPVKNVPVANIKQLVEDDDMLRNIAKTGVVTENDRAVITEKFNRGLVNSGLNGTLTSDQATALLKTMGTSGLIDF